MHPIMDDEKGEESKDGNNNDIIENKTVIIGKEKEVNTINDKDNKEKNIIKPVICTKTVSI